MSRLSVLLLFGGESPEHDVSIMSARNIYAAMDSSKYDVNLCYIDTAGKWWLLDAWNDNLVQHGGAQLVAALGSKSFITLPGNKVLRPDVIYPALHGHRGEDGTVQGLAELLHIPIVGCDTNASAVCWDKVFTKQILEQNGISIVPYILVHKNQPLPSFSEVTTHLGDVMFVKPARAGSSVGVSRVDSEEKYLRAVSEALKYSTTALIEQAVNGRELEVAVLGNPPEHKASGVGEIIPGEEFYSYEDKYAENSTAKVLTHSDIDEATREMIREQALRSFQVTGCKGLARVDFLLDTEGTMYVNEINTLPGFTNISQFPKLWHEQGMKYPALIDRLIDLAFE